MVYNELLEDFVEEGMCCWCRVTGFCDYDSDNAWDGVDTSGVHGVLV